LNVYISNPNFGRITSLHFYCWKNGLKTGMYYLRSRPAADAIQFTVDVEKLFNSTGFNTKSASAFANAELLVSETTVEEDGLEMCISCSG